MSDSETARLLAGEAAPDDPNAAAATSSRSTGVRAKTSLPRVFQERHLFCFTLSAVVGMGFFVKAGTVEAIGGPGAVVFASAVLGGLALSVSQDLSRMLRLWPIRSAHVAFIQAFVDEDVATVAGWLYIFTHCCCVAALSATVGDLVATHLLDQRGFSVFISILTVVIPILINLMDIRYSKQVLLGLVIVKLIITASIFVVMMWINPTVAHSHRNVVTKREVIFHKTGPGGYFGTMLTAIFVLCTAFVGVESIAIMAMEAVIEKKPHLEDAEETHGTSYAEARETAPQDNRNPQKDLFSMPATLVPIVSTSIYVLLGWIATENISWRDDRLPTLDGHSNAGLSIFIASALDRSKTLGTIVAWSMIEIAVSSSATALYVASRSLFGMALKHSGYPDGTLGTASRSKSRERFFLFLTRKSRFNVPWVAVVLSGLIPGLFPFVRYIWPSAIGSAIHCIVKMGTISCVLVWSLESFAHWRFCRCLRRNQNLMIRMTSPELMKQINSNGWYYYHISLSLLTAVTCMGVAIGGIVLIHLRDSTLNQLLPSVSVFIILIGGTFVPKVKRTLQTGRSAFHMANLHDDEILEKTFARLNAQQTANYGHLNCATPKLLDFFGIIDSEWLLGKA